jgi:E3 ubiquitin-protein ligase HECTD4
MPVADILGKLLETEGGPGHVPALLGSKHILCWGFEDLLSGTEKESGEKDKGIINLQSIFLTEVLHEHFWK